MRTTRAAARARPPDTLAGALARLRAAGSAASTPHPPVSDRGDAAVLIGLFANPPLVLLTQRPATLSTHAGEVCFPGGRAEPGEDSVATALREAAEEVGLERRRVAEVLCTRPPVLSKHLLNVSAVVAHLTDSEEGAGGHGGTRSVVDRLGLALNPAEVESAFAVPLALFVDGPPPGSTTTRYHCRDARFGPRGPPFRLHFFEVEGEAGRTHTVWGLTAGLLIDVAALALGRAPAFQVGPDAAPGLHYSRMWLRNGVPTVRDSSVDEEGEEEQAAA